MKFKISNPEDFWAGMMFVGFGLLAVVIARDYPMGAAMRMGPGYFPTWIGIGLMLLGAFIAFTALRTTGNPVSRFHFRPMILLALGFAFFAWAIETLGFILALAGLILIASFGGSEARVKEILVETVVLIAGAWVLFIYGLELTFPMFWWN